MNKEKHIEEMTKDICEIEYKGMKCDGCEQQCECRMFAEALYNTGYRKQSEGEWIEHIEKSSYLEDNVEVYYNCSVCGTSHWSIAPPFCPNCGAKMKGGAE